jgi:uncharacterized protein (DUF2236 family)
MVTIYGARSTAEAMIARVRRMHDMVAGTTPSGEAYCANDPELLNWVHATAAYGFLQAYHAYVRPLSCRSGTVITPRVSRLLLSTVRPAQRDRRQTLKCCFRRRPVDWSGQKLCSSFLAIMRSTPILPLPLRPFQHLLVRAAIDLTPRWLRTILRLNELGLRAWETAVVRQAAAFVDRIVLETNPAVQACRRMRLPADYLYPHNSATEAI